MGEKRNTPPRVPTHIGDHNEDRSVRLVTPRGVGLTEPPVMGVAAALVSKQAVPRHEFDFGQSTPPAMDSDTWHALQTLKTALDPVDAILELAKAERDARERREEREERERKRAYTIALIAAVGAAIAGILVALHGCS